MYHEFLLQLHSLFWGELAVKLENPSAFDTYSVLKAKLSQLELSLEQLKINYYEDRYKRQQSTKLVNNPHGSLTIRACYLENESLLMIEILNGRALKGYDKNSKNN